MKKIILSMVTMFTFVLSTQAMTYAQAREEALFLTDKMAYELNLTQEQYEAAYEINLDYLMCITGVNDVYAAPWRQRNLDLSYILYDWQYAAYEAAAYFFRPVFWSAGYWHFGIYSHYPHRTHFYFARPVAYGVYRGGHSWRRNGGHSWYVSHTHHYRPVISTGHRFAGLRDSHHNGNSRHHAEPARVNTHSNNRMGYNRNVGRNDNNRNSHIGNDRGNRTNFDNRSVQSNRGAIGGGSNVGTAQRSSTRETSTRHQMGSNNRTQSVGASARPSMTARSGNNVHSGGTTRSGAGMQRSNTSRSGGRR